MSDETIQGLRRRIGELDQLVRQLNQSGLDNARAQLLLARKRAELEDFINRGQRSNSPSRRPPLPAPPVAVHRR